MKKYSFILAAIFACMIVSCTKEQPALQDDNANPAMKTVTISATIDENLTKTSYANGTTFSWTAGDQISVLCSDGNFYTFTADQTAAESTFTGSIPSGEHLGDYAFFPADEGHLYSGLKFNIPEFKDLTSHPSADMPMVGDKGEGDSYSFMHCSGASLFTLDNIPNNIKAVKVSIVNRSLKLSGLFGVFKSGTNSDEWRWNAATGDTDSEKTFARKVTVVDGKAEVYLPYAWGSQLWDKSYITVTGYDASNQEYALVTDKQMKAISNYAFERAHVKPLTPLILNNLNNIWSSSGVVTCTLDEWQTSTVALSELKVVADDYYLYARVKLAASDITDRNYLDVYLSDGDGTEYVWKDYWLTTGTTNYKEEHKGPVSATSFQMMFNEVLVDTNMESSGDDVYLYVALPRSAHPLLENAGTVYFGTTLWQGWGIIGCLPSKRTWDHESYLIGVTLP
ncbi:MAG: hypothetical protein IKX71_09060 [Bacteroidales bacterium]|nr:hypothetical protein [Bacteroidales bacterium]